MKNILLILLIAITLLISCQQENNPIIGKWNVKQLYLADTSRRRDQITDIFFSKNSSNIGQLEFEKNGMCNVINKAGLGIGTATYKIKDVNQIDFQMFSATDELINFEMYKFSNDDLKLQAVCSGEIIFLILKRTK